jgi:GT2 family glycosyltransferase
MNGTSKIAVVILNWNGEELLRKFLPSVVKHSSSENIRIIVADNDSSDRSVELLRHEFPSVEILELDENYGFAVGYNKALVQIQADYFVLLNSDVEVTDNWIGPCIRQFENDDSLAVIQPKIMSYKEPDTFEYAGAAGGFIDKYGYPFCRGRILNRIEKDKGQYDRSTQIFWASGACMFIRADRFKQVGGFDGDFWAHMEEIDLCWRLKSLGYKIIYEPKSTVYHLGGGTLSYGSPKKVCLNFRNNLWMLFKNLPKYEFKRKMTIRMILDGVAALKFLAGFHFRSFGAVFKAHYAFYRNFSALKRKRKEIQKNVVVNKQPEIYPKSVMWKFFIQNKNKFSELNFNPK